MPFGIDEIGKKPGEIRAALGFLREQVAHPVPIAACQLVNCLDAQPPGFAEGLACAPFIGVHNIGTEALNAPRHLAVEVPVDANNRKGPLSGGQKTVQESWRGAKANHLPWGNALYALSGC